MVEIVKPTSKQTAAAIKSRDFSEVQKIRDIARQNAADIFRAVASGSVPLIWYELPPVRCQSGAVPFMRLLTVYNWLPVKYTAYGYKIVFRQFCAIN